MLSADTHVQLGCFAGGSEHKVSPRVREIWEALTVWAPPELAEPWDNIGLQIGDPEARVGRLLVALDPTEGALRTARKLGADMVVTHHPLIFHSLFSLDLSKPIQKLVAGFLTAQIALAAGHTNLDCVLGGVNDCLANALGLGDVRPLSPSAAGPPGSGMGRIGTLPLPIPFNTFAGRVAHFLRTPGLFLAGGTTSEVRRVALCAGSGSDLWPLALQEGADVYLTAEIKHSVAREAMGQGMAVIDAGHFYTEWPVVPVLASYFQKVATERKWDLEVTYWAEERSPFDMFLPGEGEENGRVCEGGRPRLSASSGVEVELMSC